jgi:methionyl-tRNA formyltransferase
MSVTKMRLGYFADGPWSHRALEKILADVTMEVVFICARFDNPDAELYKIATGRGIPFLTHPDINSEAFASMISNLPCDLFISMSFNQIFRRHTIDIPREKTINCHAGKLPFYRGRNILNWALINDEQEFGITVHYVDEGVDTGDIVLQKIFPITDADNYGTLLERAYVGCADVLYSAIQLIQTGRATRTPQRSIHPIGSYCSSRKVGDEIVNWNTTSREIFNFVRAICRPGPEARTFAEGNEVRINRIDFVSNAPTYIGIPGAILQKENGALLVKTIDSFVRVVEWSSESPVKVGDRFK